MAQRRDGVRNFRSSAIQQVVFGYRLPIAISLLYVSGKTDHDTIGDE